MFKLYDTMTKGEVALPSLEDKNKIEMYVCGPTVYQRAHIGNAMPYIVFAWMKNWLLSSGYEVNFVHNITDINDKIYVHSPEGINSADHALEMAEHYKKDIALFNMVLPDAMPTVTDTVPEIIQFIEKLIEDEFAYTADGDVYFEVSKAPNYGKLSGTQDHSSSDDGDDSIKRSPKDFALWKSTKEDEDTSWDSPWGKGRPGWHIECSAMAYKELGERFDIHGGGNDLTFPHHENEVTQSNSAGYEFADIWAHSGMLTFGGKKMSKSDGNIEPIFSAVEKWGSEVLLLLFLNSHWHGPVEYSQDTLAAATARCNTLLETIAVTDSADAPDDEWEKLQTALDNNFNTSQALAILLDWVDKGYKDLTVRFLDIFALQRLANPPSAPKELVDLAEQRLSAKAEKNFELSDKLRDEIAETGWLLRDEADGYKLIATAAVLKTS